MSELKTCPFCGGEVKHEQMMDGAYSWNCQMCGVQVRFPDDCFFPFGAMDMAWNTRYERTCTKVPGKMVYGERRSKCSECSQSLGDKRWNYCPNCGAKVIKEE